MAKRISIRDVADDVSTIRWYTDRIEKKLQALETAPAVRNRVNLDKERAVIEAALKWAFCPSAGGYADGPAIEDTCEDLSEAVRALVEIDPHDLDDSFAERNGISSEPWWPTVAQVNAELAKKTKYRIDDPDNPEPVAKKTKKTKKK